MIDIQASHTGACCAGAAPLLQPEQVADRVHRPAVTESPPNPAPFDHQQLTAALNHVISTELGLRGFMLTLAVEKAHSVAELRSVVQRTVDQIRAHHGDAAAAAARHTLDGA